jgi:hypothetical protein
MEILTTVGAALTGLLTLAIGVFALASIWIDDLN